MSTEFKYRVGIDGGGSGSRFAILNLQSAESYTVDGPRLQASQIRPVEIAELIYNVLQKETGNSRCSVFAGIAGAGRSKVQKEIQDEFESMSTSKIRVISDAEASYYDYYGIDKQGLLLVLGTGSVIVGEQNGKLKPFGGYGPDSYECFSGRELGRKAVSLLGQAMETGTDKDAFYLEIKDILKAENRHELISRITQPEFHPASLASFLIKHADAGQPECRNVLDNEAVELQKILKSALHTFPSETIALSGGLFKNPLVKNIVVGMIKDEIKNLHILEESKNPAMALCMCNDESLVRTFPSD